MKETNRSIKLFKDLYNGNPWIDVNLVNVLNHLNAIQASIKIFPNCNSIWEITNQTNHFFPLLQTIKSVA